MWEGPLGDPPPGCERDVFDLPLEQVLWDTDRRWKRLRSGQEQLRRAWLLVAFFGCLEAAALLWILAVGNEFLRHVQR